MSVAAAQRFTRTYRCPICNGCSNDQRGGGRRCHGFLSSDGRYAHCSRTDFAADLPMETNGTYAHRLEGACNCRGTHNPAPARPTIRVKSRGRIVATYPYRDRAGALLFEVVRKDPKTFSQRRPDPHHPDKWLWNLDGVPRVLYRLPELQNADPTALVFIPEGEKDADRLISIGLVATCNPGGAEKWQDTYSDSLRGRHAVIVADNDESGQRHADQVARSLRGVAASVRVLMLPNLPEKGDVSDWLDAGGSAAELLELAAAAPQWAPVRLGGSDNAQPRSLADVMAVFERWLYLPDPAVVYVVLATVAANQTEGDPTWLMLVGASSGGKTEILNALSRLSGVHAAATITEAGLLSGTSKRERGKDASGGLLREVGEHGLLILKDFTSVLSMNRDQRAALLAALREIFDGSWTRRVGVDGGRSLEWHGHLGMIAGCTSAIDTHHAVVATLGERWVYWRLPDIDPAKQARKALANHRREAQLRRELSEAVAGLFAGIDPQRPAPEMDEVETSRLIALASLAARSRSAVDRDGRTREIELILDPEAPARLAQALQRLYGGLLAIGLDQAAAWRVIVKTGLDCMPKIRRAVFGTLTAAREWMDTTAIATHVGYPTQTARRALEDLAVHGITERRSGGKGKTDVWRISGWARTQYETLSVPELSRPERSPETDEGSAGSSLYNTNTVERDFSGTPPGESRQTHCWRCREPLTSEGDAPCLICGWLLCACGACEEGCAGASQPGDADPPAGLDALRSDLAAAAEASGFPRVAYKPAHSVGPGPDVWERFWRLASSDDLTLALATLQASSAEVATC